MGKNKHVDNTNKLDELIEKSKDVFVTGRNIIVKPLIYRPEENNSSDIVLVKDFSISNPGSHARESVVTEAGKVHIVEVLKCGEGVCCSDIAPGCILRIIPVIPEDIVDRVLSNTLGDVVAVINEMVVICGWKPGVTNTVYLQEQLFKIYNLY